MVPRIGVGVIVIKNNTVLIGKRINAHGEGTWAFPGGHLEFYEDIEQCARREVLEETGLELKNVTFATITNDLFISEQKHYITIFMRSEYISGEPQLLEPHKCAEWVWATWHNLPEPLFLTMQNLKTQGYSPF
ncbi:MAG: NUDIX hydrolase [Candidatus Babeliales bacterium]